MEAVGDTSEMLIYQLPGGTSSGAVGTSWETSQFQGGSPPTKHPFLRLFDIIEDYLVLGIAACRYIGSGPVKFTHKQVLYPAFGRVYLCSRLSQWI